MDAISQNFSETDACIRAIKAGVDICLMPTILRSKADMSKMDAILDGVEAAVNSGEISVDRINESVKRILSLKEREASELHKRYSYLRGKTCRCKRAGWF